MPFFLPSTVSLPAPTRVSATLASNVSTLTSIGKIIAWDGNDAYDTAVMHDKSVNNERLVAITNGFYRLDAVISYQSNVNGGRQVSITHSRGSTVLQVVNVRPNSSGNTEITISAHVEMLAGEHLFVSTAQSSGSTINILSAQTRCYMTRLGD